MSEESEVEGYATDWVPITDKLWGRGFLVPGGANTVDRTVAGLDLQGKRILDIGSGIGGPAIKLAEDYGASVVGVDIVEDYVTYGAELAKEVAPSAKVEFRLIEAGELPLSDASFDCVFTSGVLCHLEDRKSLLRDAFRVLKPGGYVTGYDWFVEEPNPETTRWEEVGGFKMYPTTLGQRLELLRSIGFVDVVSEDLTGPYTKKIVEEIATLEGPYFEKAASETSTQVRDHFIEEWKCMKAALDTGLVKQGLFRGKKPE